MKIISFTGISGGCGTTTVTAQIAASLAARGRKIIVFDFSPQNSLRFHFGMKWEDGNGLIPQILSGRPWNEAAYRCENGVDFVPFGKCSEQDIVRFGQILQQNPGWLGSRLHELDVDNDTSILIDCPRNEYELRAQAHALSSLIIVVAQASTPSYAALADPHGCFAPENTHKVSYLINNFDPLLALDRDIAGLISVDQKAFLCPVIIHRDESVREALASKLSIDAYAPESQAAADFSDLATWLNARLADSPLPAT